MYSGRGVEGLIPDDDTIFNLAFYRKVEVETPAPPPKSKKLRPPSPPPPYSKKLPKLGGGGDSIPISLAKIVSFSIKLLSALKFDIF